MGDLKFYRDYADWWPLLSPASDYAEEAAAYERIILDHATRPVETLLELGSGGGNNASFLKRRFRMTLVDPSEGMRRVSAALNADCEHVAGDMRDIRLGRQFDAVFVHDAVCYMTTEPDLRAAMTTAFVHCAPGGVVLFAPDYVKERFKPGTDHGGGDAPDGRGLRYLEWVRDPDPADSEYIVDYAFMLRERDGAVSVVHDRHVEGLFSETEWTSWLTSTGFEAVTVVEIDHTDLDPGSYRVIVGRRPVGPEGSRHA